MKTDSYFKLFTNCIAVRGFNRSVIMDIGRDYFTTIPDTMHDVINNFNAKKSIADIIELYGEDNRETIEQYLEYLIENDFGIITDLAEFDQFIDMDKSFESPSYISNCILEFGEKNKPYLGKIINSLEHLYCAYLQVIWYNDVNLSDFLFLLQSSNDSHFRSIELILPYSEELIDILPDIENYNSRITSMIIYNSGDRAKTVGEYYFPVHISENKISNFLHCGVVDPTYFEVNRDKILESFNHNSCLNKKISIDKNGNIKNCPAIPNTFGNIKDISLEEALHHPDFRKYWNITKDQIEVCKDCEFRHICTDCRAYTQDYNNIYSKPLKCGYDPYTNRWEEWSTNPLKEKSIMYYGMQELVKKDA